MHLGPVSDLTIEAFIQKTERFIWFLNQEHSHQIVSQFCFNQIIQWDFIHEKAPHFSGLLEAAVKSFKTRLKRVTTNFKLTCEKFFTVLTQIEACLNSQPLTHTHCNNDGVEALTPRHFLIGRPLLRLYRMPLIQINPSPYLNAGTYVKYINSLKGYTKWNKSTCNVKTGNVVIVCKDGFLPTKIIGHGKSNRHPSRTRWHCTCCNHQNLNR